MLISHNSTEHLKRRINSENELFCSGLYLSARWFVLSEVAEKGIHLIILPNKEAAEYCSGDLYNLIEGDCVFYLPDSGKAVERSNYKSSLGVQRTSTIATLMKKPEKLYIVSYPEAIEEKIPDNSKIKDTLLTVSEGQRITFEQIKSVLFERGFEKVDFVSAPGQFAIRGSLIDIFSYSNNNPYRLSFFGNDIDEIHIFDCNTQLSIEKVSKADIYPDMVSQGEGGEISIIDILPEDTVVWLDSSDMYKDRNFYPLLGKFKRVYMEVPVSKSVEDAVEFHISPQPVFNKSFELLISDVTKKMENGYKIYIYGEKEAQLERLKSIILEETRILPEFVKGKNIHSGFIDNDDKICCYSDHEIFDRFHRVRLRRSVEKTEQLTINDLNAFNIGDYVVHIDHGVGIYGGLVKMTDDKGRVHEVVKITYKDNDVVFVSVHSLHKISRFRSKEGEPPKINKLGSKTWQNMKNTAKSKVKDIAKDLIRLYAKRRASKGFAFSPDTYLQEELQGCF